MEYYYEIAGVPICVCGADDELYVNHGVMEPFVLAEQPDECYRLMFSLVDALLPPAGECIYQDEGKQIYHLEDSVVRYAGSGSNPHMRIRRQGSSSEIQCLRSAYPGRITPKTVMNAMEAEHLIARNGGVILHASFIRHRDKAILFTAPSGTGKSTQADLWSRFLGAELINGDRAVIRCENGQVYACGIPFAGSSGVAKKARLPLAAIVYLTQAKENVVQQLQGVMAFRNCWEGCSVNIWDSVDLAMASDTLVRILQKVPVLHLACRPDLDAVNTLKAFLQDSGVLPKIEEC